MTPPVKTLNTADLVVLTIRDDRLKVLLVVRGKDPFRGLFAFPGGFLREGEDLDGTAHRELAEETGLDGSKLPLQQLHTYSAVGRDPRGPVVTTAYLAIAPNLPAPVGASDADSADWYEVDDELRPYLAFDHSTILSDAIETVRSRLERFPLATAFCADTFTIAELRRVYELVWDTTIDAGNFRRKVVDVIDGFVESTGQKRQNPDGGRPAELYRAGTAKVLHPPYVRPVRTDSA
jgi:ADP-ribose pyrophosphatase YjhB (NUDIX family)